VDGPGVTNKISVDHAWGFIKKNMNIGKMKLWEDKKEFIGRKKTWGVW